MSRAYPSRPSAILFLAAAVALSLAGCASSTRLAMTQDRASPPNGRSSLGSTAPSTQPAAVTRAPLPPPRAYQWNGSEKRIAEGATPRSAEQPPRVVALAPQPAAPSTSQPAAAEPRTLGRGEIEVQPGDTLYGLSRRHGVSISALMEINRLKSATLQPGQVLRLPTQSRPKG